jgi:RND family efflux transporter MFP subunit
MSILRIPGGILATFLSGWLTAASADEAIPVTVRNLSSVLVDREIRAPAEVIPANRAVVTAQITALIEEIAVDVGSVVASGDLLVRLDAADARLAVARAEADLAALDAQVAEAEQRLARAEELLENAYISDDELDNRQTALAVLVANRERQRVARRSARLELARTEVKSPFDAVVVERAGQVGSLATPSAPLLTIVQVTNPEVEAEIDPRHAPSLADAEALRFLGQAREWSVSLARLSGVIEPNTRKQRARFSFVSDSAPIGSTGELVWNESSALVPVALIVQRDRRFGVFTVDDGRARFLALPAAQEGRPAAIDLPGDTPIVIRGHVRLQDGDALQISQE